MDFTRIFDFVGDIPDGAKYVAALIFVLILILLVSWILKKISGKVRRRSSDGGRLKVGESIMLDSQRTLTLVSCDDVEHLILLGDTNDLVIAANINNPDPALNHHGFSDTGNRVTETPAPVQAAPQTTSAPPPRVISSQEPVAPEPLPPKRQPAPYREASRNTAVQALAKPAPRPRPSTLPPGPGRRGPETRPRPVPPAHSEPGQLNGEEGVGAEDATSQTFAEIRPGDEK
jgi:flagellar biogenesis protein FliO